MENLSEQNLRIVPFKPHQSHKLEWKKFKGEYQEELFVSFLIDNVEYRCNVGHIMEILEKPNGKVSHYYGVVNRIGISSHSASPDCHDIDVAKKWVENNYGIFCHQTELESLNKRNK